MDLGEPENCWQHPLKPGHVPIGAFCKESLHIDAKVQSLIAEWSEAKCGSHAMLPPFVTPGFDVAGS